MSPPTHREELTYGIHTDLATGIQYAAEYCQGGMVRAWPIHNPHEGVPEWDEDIRAYLDKQDEAETHHEAHRLHPGQPRLAQAALDLPF